MSLPNYGNIFPDDILGRIRDLEAAVNELEGGTFAAIVTLAGDVTGQSDATVVEAIQGYAVSSTAPGSGEVLEWDGSAWTPTALGGGTGDLSKNTSNAVTTVTSLRSASTAPTWRMERSLGTAGSPTAITSGYTLGGFTFGGHDGSAFTTGASAGLFGLASQDWTGSANGTNLTFEVTKPGDTSRTVAARAVGLTGLTAIKAADKLISGTVPFGGKQADLNQVKRTVTATSTSGSADVTATAGTFSLDDVGMSVTSASFPDGTTVSSVLADGSGATFSANATATGAASTAIGRWNKFGSYALRGHDLFIGHRFEVDAETTDNWAISPVRIQLSGVVNHNPNVQASAWIPGPSGTVQIDGTVTVGADFVTNMQADTPTVSLDAFGGPGLNFVRVYTNESGSNAGRLGYLNGVVNSDTYQAVGGTHSITHIWPHVTNSALLAATGGTLQVGQLINLSNEDFLFSDVGAFGTGDAVTVGLYNPVWATPATAWIHKTVTISATGGTFTLTVNGETTAAIAYNASDETVANALNDLTDQARNFTKVLVENRTAGEYRLRFEREPVTLTASGAGLTGGAGTATVTAGVSPSVDTAIGIDWGGQLRRKVLYVKATSGSQYLTAYTDGTYTTVDTAAFHEDDVGMWCEGFVIPRPFVLAVTGPAGAAIDGTGGCGSTIKIDQIPGANATGTLWIQVPWRGPASARRNIAARFAGQVQLFPTGSSNQAGQIRFTSIPTFVRVPGRYVYDFSDAIAATVFSHTATHRFKQSAGVFTFGSLFSSAATIENDPSAAANPGLYVSFFSGNTYQANSQTGITQTTYDFLSQPRYSTTGSGSPTLTVSDATGFRAAMVVNSGATITARHGLRVTNFTGAGTVTSQYGILIDSLTGATNNYGIYNNSSTYLNGAVTVVGTLSLTGNSTLIGTLDVTSNVGVGGTLACNGAFSTSSNASVGGNLSVTGTHPFLSVDGNFSTITGTLGLFGAGAFANAPLLALRRAQGTAGSPTNITSGLNLAVLGFYGYNSANGDYLGGAFIRAVSEEAWSTTGYRGTRLEFLTALSATNSAAVVRALINNAGNFYVGPTAAGAVFSVLQASGNTSVSGTLGVTGAATLSSTLGVTGATTLSSTLGVTGATTLSSTLDVTGLATVTQGTVGQPVMQLASTATNDDPTETVRQFRLQTTSNSPQTLGDASLPASSTTMVQAFVVARTTAGGTANDGAGYILTAVFQNGVQIGTTSQTVVGENQSAWDATLNYNANKWRIVVTGAASVTITWHATVRSWSVGS